MFKMLAIFLFGNECDHTEFKIMYQKVLSSKDKSPHRKSSFDWKYSEDTLRGWLFGAI